MEKNSIKLYGTKVFGEEVSKYGLEHGYLDYLTLSKIVGPCILNNSIHAETYTKDWEILCGWEDEDQFEEIYQWYIITEAGYKFLAEYTDEIVYYNPMFDIYLWAITHFGTGWDYVLTDVKLVEVE